MKNEVSQRFAEGIISMSKDYAINWQAQAKLYQDLGLYQKIADFAGVSSEHVWVDLGCGTGELISFVAKEMMPTMTGVDNNGPSLELAQKRLKKEGHKVNSALLYMLSITGPPLSFKKEPYRPKGYEIKEDEINLIFDDIKSPHLLDGVLDRNIADLITFSFGGIPMCSRFEGEYALDYDFRPTKISKEDVKRHEAIMNKIRKAVFEKAVILLKKGGHLIYAERIKSDNSSEVNMEQHYIDFVGPHKLTHIETVFSDLQHEKSRNIRVGLNGQAESDMELMLSRFEFRG